MSKELDIKPWMKTDFQSTLQKPLFLGEFGLLKADVIIRFPIPVMRTLIGLDIQYNHQNRSVLLYNEIVDMIENNIRLKDFVYDPDVTGINPLPYTVITYLYSYPVYTDQDSNISYGTGKVGCRIEYSREKYIENAKYPINAEEVYEEYKKYKTWETRK